MSNLKLLYGSFHSSLVARSFSSTCLFSSRNRLLSFIRDVGVGNLSEIPRESGLPTRFSFRNLWRKKRNLSCRNFCEFKREVKSSDIMTVYLFAFAFSSLFDFWVLQAFPILIYHLFVVNTLRAFKSRLVKRISVFRLFVFPLWHNKGNNCACSYQPIRWKRAGWFVCVLIGSVGRENWRGWQKRIWSNIIFFIKQRVNWKKETPLLPLLTKP